LRNIQEKTGNLARSTGFEYASALTWPCSAGYLNQVIGPLGGRVNFTAATGDGTLCTKPPPAVTSRTETDPITGRSWAWTYNFSGWQQDAFGYAEARVLTPPADGSSGAQSLAVHSFHTITNTNNTDLTHLAGREFLLRTCDAYDIGSSCTASNELTRTETDWQHTTAGVPGNQGAPEQWKPRFVYASETRTYELGQPFKRTTYEYQVERQGGQKNYGNPTRVKEYNSQDNNFKTNAFRTTSIWYYPNPTTGIIGLPARRQLYIGDETTLFAETRNYYDNPTDYTAPPIFGRLKRVETLSVLNGAYQSNPASISQYYDYYDNGNPKWAQDANGNTTTYFYDAGFQAFRVCAQNAAGHQTKTTYYGVPGDGACNTTNGSASTLAGRFGQPEKAWDANNALTEYAYDDLGRPLKIACAPNTLASNTQTQWFHYKPISETISAGNPFWMHSLQRDEQAPNSNYLHTWTFYDGFGRVLQTQDEADNARHVETSYTYTWRDAVARASVPRFVAGEVARHPENGGPPWPAYAALDEPTWAGLPKTVYAYDALGRATQVTAPDNATTRQYYAVGLDEQFNTTRRLAAVIDARNVQTIRAYDVFGRLSRSKEFSATDYTTPRWGDTPYATAIYRYNIGDQLTDAYDPANNRIQVFYDGLGRKSAMIDPDLGAWSYTYDAAGNLQTQTDARNTTLWFGYDTLNRLTQKRLSNSGGTLLAEYKYDETGYGYSAGRRTRAIAYVSGFPNNTSHATYDVRGRVSTDIRTIDSVNYTTGYTYDAADRVRTTTYPVSGEVVTTTYTAQGLPYSLTSPPATYVFSTTYDALGRTELRAYQLAALQSDYVYYAWSAGVGYGGRLQRLKSGVSSGGTTLQNLTYAYDPAGNLARLRDDNNSSQRQCFSYDPLGRLSGALIGDANCAATTGGNGYYPPEVYAYAADGNLTRKAGVSYTYQDAAHKHAVTHLNGVLQYSYDVAGNMTSRTEDSTTYAQAYDAENRLSTVTVSGQTTSYSYDADGALVKKVQGGQTTVYAGQHFEKNLTSGQATSYYFLGGQRVAMKKAGTLYYLLTDRLGSTSVVTTQSGGVVAQQLYKPWGEARWISGTLPTDRKFTGQRSEEATLGSLYDYGARAYSPRLGRFLSADPIVPAPGDPQSLNRYAYTLNNPLRYTDPSGHCIGPFLPLCIQAATWAAALTVSAEVYYGPHAEAALFGAGPDSRGLRIVQQHRGLIESAAGAQPIIVAAGIAVQSQWGGFPQDWVEVNGIPGILPPDTNASLGIASMTASEMQGYGGNALNPADAVQALSQKIQKSVAACTGCSATDQFIVAGMAQNGFTPKDVGNALAFMSNGTIAWSDYFARQSAPSGDRRAPWLGMRSGGRSWNLFQLQLFLNDVLALIAQGWTPPEGVDLGYIQCVVSGGNCE
jgi:RHS repeat-associated protein